MAEECETMGGGSDLGDGCAEDVAVPKRFWWLKRLVALGFCLLVGLVLLRLLWGFEADRRLQAEIDRVRATGQLVTIRDFNDRLDAVADEDNAAILFEEAIAGMTKASSSGFSLHGFLNEFSLFFLNEKDAAELFDANSTGLELVHQARSKPEVAWSARLSGLNFFPGKHAQQREMIRLLWFSATYQRLAGDHEGAFRTIHDAIAFCEAIESRPTVIANLVARACYGMTFTLIEDLMTGFSIDQAADGIQPASRHQVEALLAKLLDESGTRSAAVASCYGDGASYLRFLESVDEQGISAVFGTRAGFADRLLDPLRKPLYTLDVVHAVRLQTQIVTAIGLPNWPKADACIPSGEDRRSVLHSLTHPVTDSMFGSLLRSARSQVRLHFRFLANRRMAATALAILLFEHDHGRRPLVLEELVPAYLPQVPIDPFSPDGAGFFYKPDAENPLLYSISNNGVDDGGVRDDWMDIPFSLNGRERWREAKIKGALEEAVGDDED